MKTLIRSIDAVLPKLPGWCTPQKAHALAELILTTKPEVSVEIGVFGGSSLIPQALAHEFNSRGRVYGIDPWSKDASLESVQERENLDWWAGQDYENIYRNCLRSVLELGLTEWCSIIRAKSEKAVNLFDSVIDVLHIDGNHSEEKSVNDVFLYLPKVRPEGFVWFDDVDWHSTKRAVSFVEEQCERIKSVGTCVLYRKR